MRYLVSVEPDRMKEVQMSLSRMRVGVVTKIMDYIVVDIPPERVAEVRAIPGVIEVIAEEKYKIAVMPVEAKLRLFARLLSNPLTAPMALAWSATVKPRERWPTDASRKVVEADLAEREGITGRGVKVAVLDTGIDAFGCPQLPITPVQGESTVEGQPWWQDENGHGTWVATAIGGQAFSTPWGIIKGVAPGATLIHIKCLGYGIGTGTTTAVLKAMQRARELGADVVNMSLGGDVKPDERHNTQACPLCRAVKALSEAGQTFVIAAGNSGVGFASCPGIAPEAVTVAAINSKKEVADFVSRRHPQYIELEKPTVSAPGVNVLSSSVGLIDLMEWMDGPKLAAISGTSMATPHATGVIALWLEYAKKKGYVLTYKDIHECIKQGRDWDPDYGYGIIKYSWIKEYIGR